MIQTPQVVYPSWDRPVEAVPGQIQVLERGHCAQNRWDPTREVVVGKSEVLQCGEASERVELELASEAEAVEGQGDDIAAVVAENAGPGRAGLSLCEDGGVGPCAQDFPERVGLDPFLEFVEGSELRLGG